MIDEAHNPAQPFTSVARAKNLFKAPSKPSKVAELAPTPPGAPENLQALQTAFQEAGLEGREAGALNRSLPRRGARRTLVPAAGNAP